jgi:flagellar biosynthetic protein FliR
VLTFHLNDLSGLVFVYMLVFVRTGAMLMFLPPINQAGVPQRVRLVLALAISAALAPGLAHNYPVEAPTSPMALALLIAEDAIAGFLVGGMATIVMSGLSVAGSLISTQTGLAYAQLLNPTMGDSEPVVGNFLTLLGAVMIFATNMHHLAIGAIQGSYTLIPPGGALPTADMAELTIRLVSGSFALGIQLAAPFLVFSFAVNASIGLLARMMPQLQVFFIAMPINLLAGFLIIMLLIGTMMTIFLNYYGTQMGNFI